LVTAVSTALPEKETDDSEDCILCTTLAFRNLN